MNTYSVELNLGYDGSILTSVVNSFEDALEAKEALLKEHNSFNKTVTIVQWQNGSSVWSEEYFYSN